MQSEVPRGEGRDAALADGTAAHRRVAAAVGAPTALHLVGIALHDLDGTLLWAKTGRGGSGVAFDPGFPGGDPALGTGVAWTKPRSGRYAVRFQQSPERFLVDDIHAQFFRRAQF